MNAIIGYRDTFTNQHVQLKTYDVSIGIYISIKKAEHLKMFDTTDFLVIEDDIKIKAVEVELDEVISFPDNLPDYRDLYYKIYLEEGHYGLYFGDKNTRIRLSKDEGVYLDVMELQEPFDWSLDRLIYKPIHITISGYYYLEILDVDDVRGHEFYFESLD